MAKRTRRVKLPKGVLTVGSWEKADDYIREIGDLQLLIKAAEEKANDDINETRAELAGTVKPCQEAIKLYARSLEAFATANKGDFKNSQSRKLNFGCLGWRKSKAAISVKKTTLDLIKKVFSKARAAGFIHTKETVDKEALARLTDGQLAKVGATRKHKEVFFVDPDLPEAVDYVE